MLSFAMLPCFHAAPFAKTIRHSPFAIRHSPFAIRHPPFAIRFIRHDPESEFSTSNQRITSSGYSNWRRTNKMTVASACLKYVYKTSAENCCRYSKYRYSKYSLQAHTFGVPTFPPPNHLRYRHTTLQAHQKAILCL